MTMQQLSGSVGLRGQNKPDDVEKVQILLQKRGLYRGGIDKKCGDQTITAIKAFQRQFTREPDGLVEPNKTTWKKLTGQQAAEAASPVVAVPVSGIIRVVRKWQTVNSTIGELHYGGAPRGYVLERPGPDTVARGQNLRVPIGTYWLRWHQSSLAGVRRHNPVPHLYNDIVSQDRYILIHNGNEPRHSKGCLLTGKTKGSDFVGESVAQLNLLKDYLNEVGIESVTLVISESYG